MIETLRPPREKSGGIADCDECGAQLKYAADNVTKYSEPRGFRQQMAQFNCVTHTTYYWAIDCPHCKSEIRVPKL